MIKEHLFAMVEVTGRWRVVYCTKTKVMYVVSDGSGNVGNFAPLVNPDGSPMLYEGE